MSSEHGRDVAPEWEGRWFYLVRLAPGTLFNPTITLNVMVDSPGSVCGLLPPHVCIASCRRCRRWRKGIRRHCFIAWRIAAVLLCSDSSTSAALSQRASRQKMEAACAPARVRAFVPASSARPRRLDGNRRICEVSGATAAAASAAPPQPAAAAARRRRATAAAAASGSAAPAVPAPQLPIVEGAKNVVVLGGTGRVGSSTAAALAAAVPGAQLRLGGRSEESFRAAVERRPELAGALIISLDHTRRCCS